MCWLTNPSFLTFTEPQACSGARPLSGAAFLAVATTHSPSVSVPSSELRSSLAGGGEGQDVTCCRWHTKAALSQN